MDPQGDALFNEQEAQVAGKEAGAPAKGCDDERQRAALPDLAELLAACAATSGSSLWFMGDRPQRTCASWARPGVAMTAGGRPSRSTARCVLAVGPPRDRPVAWSAGSPPGAGVSLLLWPVAALVFFSVRAVFVVCWRVRSTAESTETVQSIPLIESPWAVSWASTVSQVPSAAHPRRRFPTVCQGPHASWGGSLRGEAGAVSVDDPFDDASRSPRARRSPSCLRALESGDTAQL